MTALLLLLGVVAGEIPDAGLAIDLRPASELMDAERGEAQRGGDGPAEATTVFPPDGGTDATTDAEGPPRAWLRGRILAKGSRGPVLGARVTVTGEPGAECGRGGRRRPLRLVAALRPTRPIRAGSGLRARLLRA